MTARRLVQPGLLLFAVLALSGGSTTSGQDTDVPTALTRSTLVVGTKEAPPFVIRGADGQWRGITIELWDRVAEALDVGYRFEERSLDELVAGLADGTLDVSAAALTVTAERERQIDFSHPFHSSGLGIAVPESGGAARIIGLIGRMFSLDFAKGLAALAAVLLAAGTLVWLFERRRNESQFGGPPVRGLGSGFWWSAVTMTTVGYGDKAPVTAGGRLVALVWMFASIVTISGFTAAIASTLTVEGLGSAIDGPSDLPGRRVATVGGSTSEAYLQRRGIRASAYERVEAGLEAVAAEEVAAMVYDEPILRYYVLHSADEEIGILPGTFERQDYALGLPEDSPLRESINQHLLLVIADPAWRAVLDEYLGEDD